MMRELLKKYCGCKVLAVNTYQWRQKSFRTASVTVGLGLTLAGIVGLKLILGILFIPVALLLGLSMRFYIEEPSQALGNIRRVSVVSSKLPRTEFMGSSVPEREPRSKLDMRITGSALIDETIHEMIDYILRDYVHSWYDHITEDDQFIHELRRTTQETLVTLSARIKEIDWTPYITTHLVDDAASHLRLFRQSTAKVKENPISYDLISVFFDMESSMERNLCRDMACTDDSHLNDYFQGLCEGLLYFLLPQETYGCSPVGSLAQDLLVNHVLIPVINLIADPDFVNQTIVWLCQDFTITPEIFMSVIRTCDTMEELFAAQAFFTDQVNEVKNSPSTTPSSDDMNTMKQQLRCLGYVRKAIDLQISHLKEGRQRDWIDEADVDDWQHYFMTPGLKLHTLSLEEVMKNSIALSYFLDYMSSVGGNHYLLMYLNADAWRVSAEQQLLEIETSNRNAQHGKDQNKSNQEMLNCMRDAAFNVYDQFLSEKAAPRVKLSESVTKKFYVQVRTEAITSGLFDQIQEAIIDTLQCTDKFFPGFTRNKLYIKCLMELDLLKAETVSVHSQSSASDEDEEDGLDGLIHVNNEGEIDHRKSFTTVEALDEHQTCRECLKHRRQGSGFKSEELLAWEKDIWEVKYKLRAEIIEVALTNEKGNTFGIYVVKATRFDENRLKGIIEEKEWHIYRRYSDFHDFHHWIKSKWMRMSKLEFPSKQTFGKTDRAFLEKRMAALNKYLNNILAMTVEPCFGESLQDSLLHFLEPGNYVVRKKQFSEKIDSLVNMTVNPLKQSVKNVTHAVKTMPDTLINTMDVVTKLFHSKNAVTDFTDSMKVGASIDTEADDNIPLRIILLLMDEVFDLKSRNQWLRRRIVVIIRQVIKTMMGDNLNRRIVDYVAYLTSPVRVSGYLRNLQYSLWPGGRKISVSVTRDSDTKMKTRIAAKASLLSSLSDELKHLIGSETTRRGLLCVFDMCQNPVLNRRFLLVLIEGILRTLYADKPFPSLIQRLHFRSTRVGKHRPFLVPLNNSSSGSLKASTMPMANLSPRGSRKRKS